MAEPNKQRKRQAEPIDPQQHTLKKLHFTRSKQLSTISPSPAPPPESSYDSPILSPKSPQLVAARPTRSAGRFIDIPESSRTAQMPYMQPDRNLVKYLSHPEPEEGEYKDSATLEKWTPGLHLMTMAKNPGLYLLTCPFDEIAKYKDQAKHLIHSHKAVIQGMWRRKHPYNPELEEAKRDRRKSKSCVLCIYLFLPMQLCAN